MVLLKIGSANLPNPSSYKVSRSDMDGPNTKRTEAGVLNRERVRAGVYKIQVSWGALTMTELTAVTTALTPAEFTVTFFDPTTATAGKTAKMYAGDRSAELVRVIDENKTAESRWSLSVSLTEF